MYYVNWKLLFEFGFIFFLLMCALNYFPAERQFNVTESDSLYHYPIVQEIIEKQVQEKVNKLQPNNNSLKFHVGFFIFNILIFVLSLLHCKIIQFCFHLALKCQFDLKKIFVKQTFFPPKKCSFSKIPVLLNKTNRKSDSNLEIICRQSENVKSANCIEAKLNHKNKSCEMIFKNRRFSSNNHNLQINCEKLREEIIKLQTNSLKEQTALTRKLENALKERKELSRHLELIYKENSAAKEQLKQLVDEKTILLKRLENVTKELKLSTTTKKVALARLEEVTENFDKLQCQLEQIKRDKEIAEDKFHLLEVEYIKLQDGETKTNGCNHFLCAPERDEIEKFEEHNNLAIADSTLPQTEFDMQKIKKRITNLEKCLDSFNVVNVKFENVGLESDISSTFLDNDSLFHEDYSQMILDSSRSERRTEINLSYHESMEVPRRIVSNSQAFQNFLKKLQSSNNRNLIQ